MTPILSLIREAVGVTGGFLLFWAIAAFGVTALSPSVEPVPVSIPSGHQSLSQVQP